MALAALYFQGLHFITFKERSHSSREGTAQDSLAEKSIWLLIATERTSSSKTLESRKLKKKITAGIRGAGYPSDSHRPPSLSISQNKKLEVSIWTSSCSCLLISFSPLLQVHNKERNEWSGPDWEPAAARVKDDIFSSPFPETRPWRETKMKRVLVLERTGHW
jgi:hypothetical protein